MTIGPDVVQISTEIVYQNRWMRVREDRVRRRDGSEGIYGVVEKPDFATIAAVDGDHIHLVQQFRYPVGARHWELPQGSWQHEPGKDPLLLARAELLEETGLSAAGMVHVGRLLVANGFCDQGCDIFLASGLTRTEPALEVEEQDLIARAFPIPEVEDMIRNGEITDGTTVAAFGLLRLKALL